MCRHTSVLPFLNMLMGLMMAMMVVLVMKMRMIVISIAMIVVTIIPATVRNATCGVFSTSNDIIAVVIITVVLVMGLNKHICSGTWDLIP